MPALRCAVIRRASLARTRREALAAVLGGSSLGPGISAIGSGWVTAPPGSSAIPISDPRDSRISPLELLQALDEHRRKPIPPAEGDQLGHDHRPGHLGAGGF